MDVLTQCVRHNASMLKAKISNPDSNATHRCRKSTSRNFDFSDSVKVIMNAPFIPITTMQKSSRLIKNLASYKHFIVGLRMTNLFVQSGARANLTEKHNNRTSTNRGGDQIRPTEFKLRERCTAPNPQTLRLPVRLQQQVNII